MGSSYLEVSFELGALSPAAAESACNSCGAIAVTFIDAGDTPVLEPLPGELRLWPATRVQALFAAPAAALAALVRDLAQELRCPPNLLVPRSIAERVWEREWLKDFHALQFGTRLWICPHHERISAAGAAVVLLDPGMAFGTGAHATTALCLHWLDGQVMRGQRLIDYGCGSGILALAAVKLGAAQAFCFDIDPQALLAAADNAAANGIASAITVCADADALPAGVDVLVANILAAPLCALAARFGELVRPGGQLLLAGLMEDEAHEVTRANGACFDMQPCGKRAGWVALSGRRREHC